MTVIVAVRDYLGHDDGRLDYGILILHATRYNYRPSVVVLVLAPELELETVRTSMTRVPTNVRDIQAQGSDVPTTTSLTAKVNLQTSNVQTVSAKREATLTNSASSTPYLPRLR